jgi:hypothetical protein
MMHTRPAIMCEIGHTAYDADEGVLNLCLAIAAFDPRALASAFRAPPQVSLRRRFANRNDVAMKRRARLSKPFAKDKVGKPARSVSDTPPAIVRGWTRGFEPAGDE